ncbi:hypothetical protein ACH4VR_19755 [Streptomyces sp. NPDC020883]|uniref:zinc finger domain-containing protein n=1 Tax=Streptomyces sp. NPDC020883 TaxID=3365099 RepID=UPI0037A25880
MPAMPVAVPPPASDAAHAAAHETHRRFRHGAYSVQCPTCHVPAGDPCLSRRAVHTARRELHRQSHNGTVLVPLLVARAR